MNKTIGMMLPKKANTSGVGESNNYYEDIIESVDSISRDERGFPLTQYIRNGRIFRAV